MILALLHRIHRLLLQSETIILVALFLSLIIIAVVQIVMRNFFASGIIWAESYVRISVLWIAMIGAMVASRDDQHISIDVLVNKLPQSFRSGAKQLAALLTSAVCFAMAWFSLTFVLQEFQYGGVAFGLVPNWLCEAIIPFAFLIIALRYSIAVVQRNPGLDP